MSLHGEGGGQPDYSNEVFRGFLIAECVDGAAAYLAGVRAADSGDQISETLHADKLAAKLATATNDAELGAAIVDSRTRLRTLARIGRQTGDEQLESQVIDEFTTLFDVETSEDLLVSLAVSFGNTSVLRCIADPAKRQQAIRRVAVRLEDVAIIDAEIETDALRCQAKQEIIIKTPRDYHPLLELLPDEAARQTAIAARALDKQDQAVAAEITDVSVRVNVLLTLAKGKDSAYLPGDFGDLLRQVSDDDPVKKAEYIKKYIDLTGMTDCLADLQRLAELIEEPKMRAYFDAVIAALTGNQELARAAAATLDAHGSVYTSYMRDSMHASLAVALADYRHVDAISDQTLRSASLVSVVVARHDVEIALNNQMTEALNALVLTYDDTDLAIRYLQESPRGSGHEHMALELILKLAQKLGSMDVINRVGETYLREPLQLKYLVALGDAELIDQTACDDKIKRFAKHRLAEKLQNVELARDIGYGATLVRMLEQQMQRSASAWDLPLDEIAMVPDVDERCTMLFELVCTGNAAALAVLLENIRQNADRGHRLRWLADISFQTRDLNFAFEALNNIRGSITTEASFRRVCAVLQLIREPDTKYGLNDLLII